MTHNSSDDSLVFKLWCDKAVASGISCLETMAETIISRIERTPGYWRHGSLTNASHKGFNNKIGWLTRQAYGYRDEEYLHLRIDDLPHLKTRRDL